MRRLAFLSGVRLGHQVSSVKVHQKEAHAELSENAGSEGRQGDQSRSPGWVQKLHNFRIAHYPTATV
jgi:hypothetical protein